MDWTAKARLFRLFEIMPFGRTAYRLAQERITRSLPRDKSQIPRYLEQLNDHIAGFKRHGGCLEGASYLEFGAGWDLFYPLGFAAAGASTLHVYDVSRLAHVRYINHTIDAFAELQPVGFQRPLGRISTLEELTGLGIFYHAPGDARRTGLNDGSIDLVSTTSTLEHIPAEDIHAILNELKRVCRPGALISMLVDYEDHYGQRGGDCGPYNFLRFEVEEWRRYNPAIHYQNRLRHRDYVEMFDKAALSTLEVEEWRPKDWERTLTSIPISPDFRGYTVEELSITKGRFLLRA